MSKGVLTSRLLERAGVRHGFTTRQLGDALVDLSGWEKATGLQSQSLVRLKQVHGSDVLIVDGPVGELPPEEKRQFDASVTLRNDVILSIRTADCVPILLFAPGVVAAVHAGWRGTVNGTLKNAVEAMIELRECRADSILAAIGPCIRSCCYKVGRDVWEPFTQRFRRDAVIDRDGDRYVDLVAANRAWLLRSGVLLKNIEVLNACTHCNPETFFSHRREGSTGRQLAFITL
jgi:YfiH family protein